MQGARRIGTLLALLAAAPAFGGDRSLAVFAGRQTANVWEEVVLFDDVRFLDAGLFGVAGAYEWQLGASRFWAGAELQLVKHVGDQTHWETNAPLTLRFRPQDPWGPIDSLAFGVGLSYASRVPEIEVRREGQSRRTLFYWTAEVAFDTPRPDRDVVLRLHHRSSGFGYFGDSGSSNAVVLGLRQRF